MQFAARQRRGATHSLTLSDFEVHQSSVYERTQSATNHRRAAAAACASAAQDRNRVASVFRLCIFEYCDTTVTDWDRSRAAACVRPAVRADRGALPCAVHHDAGNPQAPHGIDPLPSHSVLPQSDPAVRSTPDRQWRTLPPVSAAGRRWQLCRSFCCVCFAPVRALRESFCGLSDKPTSLRRYGNLCMRHTLAPINRT